LISEHLQPIQGHARLGLLICDQTEIESLRQPTGAKSLSDLGLVKKRLEYVDCSEATAARNGLKKVGEITDPRHTWLYIGARLCPSIPNDWARASLRMTGMSTLVDLISVSR
jgi:hypothetical protein